jgi:hypothetical protein
LIFRPRLGTRRHDPPRRTPLGQQQGRGGTAIHIAGTNPQDFYPGR